MRKLSRDYEGRCGECHRLMDEDDSFCRYCGTPRGHGKFEPYDNSNLCVYGPPFATTHTCAKCGFSWTVTALGVDGAMFCPKCGGGVSTEYKENW